MKFLVVKPECCCVSSVAFTILAVFPPDLRVPSQSKCSNLPQAVEPEKTTPLFYIGTEKRPVPSCSRTFGLVTVGKKLTASGRFDVDCGAEG